MTRVKEVPPELEDQGVSEFDVEAFLATVPRTPGKQEPQYPRCLVDVTFGSIRHDDSSQWDYCHCPITRFGTKCYVTCGKEDLANYLKAVEEQMHPCEVKIRPEKFKCSCDLSMILYMSKSEKNPGWLYLKCPRKTCKLFQWLNEPPKGLAFQLLY